MDRPKRSTCTQYRKSPDSNRKINMSELKGLKTQISQLEGTLMKMQVSVESVLNECLSKITVNHNELQTLNSSLNEVRRQINCVQQSFLDKYIVIISYEKCRNSASYCSDILMKFQIDKKEVIGSNKIFSSHEKVIYKVELANKSLVSHVLKSKPSLRGSKIYIHRPFTDAEKVTRSKQIKVAKEIAKDQKFRISKNNLFIQSNIYQWSESEETYSILCRPNNKAVEPSQISYETSKASTSKLPKRCTAQGKTSKSDPVKVFSDKDAGFLVKNFSKARRKNQSSDRECMSKVSESSSEESYLGSSDDQEFQEVLGEEMKEAMAAMFEKSFNSMASSLQESIDDLKQSLYL